MFNNGSTKYQQGCELINRSEASLLNSLTYGEHLSVIKTDHTLLFCLSVFNKFNKGSTKYLKICELAKGSEAGLLNIDIGLIVWPKLITICCTTLVCLRCSSLVEQTNQWIIDQFAEHWIRIYGRHISVTKISNALLCYISLS
jgi:hypothetical protein